MTSKPSLPFLKAYTGLHFEPAFARARIYTQCGDAKCLVYCTDARINTNPSLDIKMNEEEEEEGVKIEAEEEEIEKVPFTCMSCLSKDRYATFAMSVVFDYDLIHAPYLFNEVRVVNLVPMVSTMEVLEVYMATLDYFDDLFNPDSPAVACDQEWFNLARDDRKRAKGYWGDLTDFIVTLEGLGNNALAVIQHMEAKIITGQVICHRVNAEREKSAEKVNWEQVLVDKRQRFISTQLHPWRIERCPADQLQKKLDKVQEANEHKRAFQQDFELQQSKRLKEQQQQQQTQ